MTAQGLLVSSALVLAGQLLGSSSLKSLVGSVVSVRFPPGCEAAAWWSGDERCHNF